MSASIRLTKGNYHGSPLLKQLGGLKRTDSHESLSRKAAVEQRKTVTALKTPMKGDAGLPSDSDGESRADIKPSNFGKRNGTAEQKKGEKTVAPTRISERSGRTRSTAKGNDSVSSSTSSNGKRAFEEEDEENAPTPLSSRSQPSLSQNIGTQHSVFGSSQSKKLRGYSGKKQKVFGSSQNKHSSSPEKSEVKKKFNPPRTVSSTPEPAPSPETKSTFKNHGINLDTPDGPTSSERYTFKNHGINLDTPDKPRSRERNTFKNYAINFDSPIAPRTQSIDPASPTKKSEKIKKEKAGLSDDDDELPEIFHETIESRNIRRRLEQKEKEEDSKSHVAKFKVYDVLQFTDGRTLQDLGLTQMDLDMADQDTALELPDHLVQCPMCKEPVEKTFIEEFSCGERMTLTAQTMFCHSHRTKSAREDWTSRGYPDIDWDALNSRINRHHQYLRSLLKPDASSYYHEQMRDALRSSSKSSRSLKSIIHNGGSLTPGYYGTRGLRIMSENIMDKFTPQLRKLSAKDEIIFAQGVSSFVQTVLVPELAVRLIQEDMQVTVAEARNILKDSATVGDLLQEELDEVVIQRP